MFSLKVSEVNVKTGGWFVGRGEDGGPGFGFPPCRANSDHWSMLRLCLSSSLRTGREHPSHLCARSEHLQFLWKPATGITHATGKGSWNSWVPVPLKCHILSSRMLGRLPYANIFTPHPTPGTPSMSQAQSSEGQNRSYQGRIVGTLGLSWGCGKGSSQDFSHLSQCVWGFL